MTMMNIRKEKAKWKKKCWLRRPGSISSFAISLCIPSVHCFWAAEINRGELILLQPSVWLTCFTGWFALNVYLRLPGRVRKSRNHLTFCSYTVFAGQKKTPKTDNASSPPCPRTLLLLGHTMQKVVLTFPAVALTSSIFSANAPLSPVIHSSSGTLTFPAELLNQYFLHPNSQFGFMIKKKKKPGRFSFLKEGQMHSEWSRGDLGTRFLGDTKSVMTDLLKICRRKMS